MAVRRTDSKWSRRTMRALCLRCPALHLESLKPRLIAGTNHGRCKYTPGYLIPSLVGVSDRAQHCTRKAYRESEVQRRFSLDKSSEGMIKMIVEPVLLTLMQCMAPLGESAMIWRLFKVSTLHAQICKFYLEHFDVSAGVSV